MAMAQSTLITQTQKSIEYFKNLAEQSLPVKFVKLGNFALLKNLSANTQSLYLLSDFAGGKKFNTSAGEIIIVTPESPFGSQLKDKMISQIVTINSIRFAVLQIF